MFACTGAIESAEPGGSGGTSTPPGPKPTDNGIIDNGGGGGGGSSGAGGAGQPVACAPGGPPATTRLFRLTHKQYENAIRALTGLEVGAAAEFPTDQNQAGFDRGMDLQVGDALGKAYRSQAEAIAAQVATSTAAFTRVVTCDPATGDTCARAFISQFGRRAYRRPLSPTEQAAFLAAFNKGPTLVDGTADNFHKGVQVVVEAMLQSPNFLYRVELSNVASSGLVALDGYEIANRLSFFLVNGPPDDGLLDAAGAGRLASADAIATEARRLVGTPAARQTVRDFHGQWMGFDSYANKLAKDASRYPTVNPDLAPVLMDETARFIEEVAFERGKGFISLLTAPFTYVNRTTAPLYGVSGNFGTNLQRVDLDPTRRAGLLTQLGFLATHAYSGQTSPIHRGTFIQRNVLCTAIPDPPPDIPEVPPLGATQTTRQQVDMHTAGAQCAVCHHTLINPPGFAFENYDAVGQYRTTENNVPIDATGTLVGTKANAPFTDGVTASRVIAESPEARKCYAATWMRYAFGRKETAGDACAIETLSGFLGTDDYKITDLMVDLTRTKAFMFRAAGGN